MFYCVLPPVPASQLRANDISVRTSTIRLSSPPTLRASLHASASQTSIAPSAPSQSQSYNLAIIPACAVNAGAQAITSTNKNTPAVPPARRVLGPNVVVYVHRMVMYGVEKQYRTEIARTAASATSSGCEQVKQSDTDVWFLCSSRRFGRFSLVEDGDDFATAKDNSDHIFPSFDNMLSSAKRRQCIAELEMQAALLAIRLKFFEGSRCRCAEDEEQTREQEDDERDEDSRIVEEAECEMRNIALGQREPAPVPTPSLSDAQVPARPIRSSPSPKLCLSPDPHASAALFCPRHT
ncbi:hypothetical protein CVT25_009708 [Psilocybe cyanescens]|uniref:Uncharacterized protein n=1 Tax=Psilocybe cyanescens TaxID=93625 RepID=A0A409WWI4_PSICY|nr:hypothetical protein CVT25_009708 [Psilocybe cyanescens]